jgi:hypothetical protein
VRGEVTIEQSGAETRIEASDEAIIDYLDTDDEYIGSYADLVQS